MSDCSALRRTERQVIQHKQLTVQNNLQKQGDETITMKRHAKHYIGWALAPILLSCAALAQPPQEPGAVQQKFQKMQQAAAMNEQELQGYQCIETTTLTIDGKPRPPQQSICRYGTDGTLRKTPLQAQEAPRVSGGPPPKHNTAEKNGEVHEEGVQIQDANPMVLTFY